MGRSPRGKVGASREDRRRRREFRGDDTPVWELGIRADPDYFDYIANVEALHHNAARLVDNNGVDVQRHLLPAVVDDEVIGGDVLNQQPSRPRPQPAG